MGKCLDMDTKYTVRQSADAYKRLIGGGISLIISHLSLRIDFNTTANIQKQSELHKFS